jgi:uncharacterized protein (DUF1800 family)
VHPSTAKFISTKLVRAFIADDPPADSVSRIAEVFMQSKGDLIAIHSAVIEEVLAVGQNYAKFTKPSVWMQMAHRTLGIMPTVRTPSAEHSKAGLRAIFTDLGEEFCSPPQPNGWPDTEADWLSIAMLDRRVRYAKLIGSVASAFKPEELGAYVDRLAGAESTTAIDVKRADTLQNAVIMLLVSPQFLRT